MKNAKKYDIIIIGSGPAGLSCAAGLANSKLKVAVISSNPRTMKFDVKGTSYGAIKELNLEKSIISAQDRFGMYSNKEKRSSDIGNRKCAS